MKRILISLVVILTLCSLTNAQQKGITVTADSTSTSVTVIGVDDTNTDSTDTCTTYASSHIFNIDKLTNDMMSNTQQALEKGIIIAIISILAVFGFPIFVIFIIFFFRYKNRKARYRLAEQAIAAGQPLPENFIIENRVIDSCSQGIKTTFTGIGLFIFLWAITDEFALGSIGLLVMFMGIGKWIIGYKQQKEKERQNVSNEVKKEEQIIKGEEDKHSSTF